MPHYFSRQSFELPVAAHHGDFLIKEKGMDMEKSGQNNDFNIKNKVLITNFETGRSMVEMLGTLAIIGVLSIGGIMGYSYGMDKYRANQTINEINLRGLDLIAQASRPGDINLSEWGTHTSTGYEWGEYGETEGQEDVVDMSLLGVPERVCEMIAEGMKNSLGGIKINDTSIGDTEIDCDDDNTMTFYFGTVLGQNNNPTPEPPKEEPDFECYETYSECTTSDGDAGYCISGFCKPAKCPSDWWGGSGILTSEECAVLIEEWGLCFTFTGKTCTTPEGTSGTCQNDGSCAENSVCEEDCNEYLQDEFGMTLEEFKNHPDPEMQAAISCFGCSITQSCDIMPFATCTTADGRQGICDPDRHGDRDTWIRCSALCKTDDDCNECSLCEDWGGYKICVQLNEKSHCTINGKSGYCHESACIPYAEDNTCGGNTCPGDNGCFSCFNDECITITDYTSVCSKNGKEGLCVEGYCDTTLCKSNDDCGSNQYCGSTNSSVENKYPKEFGICKDFAFTSFTSNGTTYYVSRDELSFYDAQGICQQYKSSLNFAPAEDFFLDDIGGGYAGNYALTEAGKNLFPDGGNSETYWFPTGSYLQGGYFRYTDSFISETTTFIGREYGWDESPNYPMGKVVCK